MLRHAATRFGHPDPGPKSFQKEKMKSVYKRVIIKLSGEALAGANGNGINEKVLDDITNQIMAVKDLGVEIGIIVGGGNFWRGRQGKEMDRSTADHMGMLATVINALGLQDALG